MSPFSSSAVEGKSVGMAAWERVRHAVVKRTLVIGVFGMCRWVQGLVVDMEVGANWSRVDLMGDVFVKHSLEVRFCLELRRCQNRCKWVKCM
jgi:hypothetical protein